MSFAPAWLPMVAVAAVAVLGGAAVARRRSRGLAAAVGAASLLLAIGLAGAWLLRDRTTAGLAWTLLVVFAIPLPLVPWLYAYSFDDRTRAGTSSAPTRTDPPPSSATSPLSPLPSSLPSEPGSRSPVPGLEGGP